MTAHYVYMRALEQLCHELTAPEPEDLTRDLEASIRQAEVGRAVGVKRMVRAKGAR